MASFARRGSPPTLLEPLLGYPAERNTALWFCLSRRYGERLDRLRFRCLRDCDIPPRLESGNSLVDVSLYNHDRRTIDAAGLGESIPQIISSLRPNGPGTEACGVG